MNLNSHLFESVRADGHSVSDNLRIGPVRSGKNSLKSQPSVSPAAQHDTFLFSAEGG